METQPSATFVEPMPMAPQIPYFTTATGLRVILVSAEKMFFSLHSKCTRVPNPSLSDPICMKFSVVCYCCFSLLVLLFFFNKKYVCRQLGGFYLSILTFICLSVVQLFKEVAGTGRMRDDFNRDKRVAGLDDITPAKVFSIIGIIINLISIIMVITACIFLRWFCTRQMARRFPVSPTMSENQWKMSANSLKMIKLHHSSFYNTIHKSSP